MTTANQVTKLYRTVVDDVTNNVKEAFLDEGVDEQILQELKQLWETKLAASKALEPPAPTDHDIIVTPQNVSVMLPQPIQTKTQEQGILGQSSQHQGATQYQMSQAAATASMALPAGLFQQQLAALSSNGQLQNITVQQTGNGQYITLSGIPSQQLSQLQQHQLQPPQLAQNLASHILQPQQIHLAQQPIRLQQQQQPIRLQQQQQQPIRLQQQQQQPKLIQASQLLQQQGQVTLTSQPKPPGGVHHNLIQIDGLADTSSSDDDDFDDDDREDDEKEEENDEEEQGEEEDPLNSDDDVSEEDPSELFDTENVVVCQYDKINRNKNKWKFHLKDGIMNLNGRDYVFQKATGDAEW